MPFPKEACSYSGGCNCRAIRYKVTIPKHTTRPDNPYDKPEPYSKLPMVAICHCNDCRRTHSSPFGFAIVNPLDWVELSLSSPETPSVPAKDSSELASESSRDQADSHRTWIPATSIFDFDNGPVEQPESWLRFYKASPRRARGFCGRCGTNLLYFVFGESANLPTNWIPQLDLWAGAVDRCDLEKDWFVPERELWLDFGIGWAMQFTKHETPVLPRFGRY